MSEKNKIMQILKSDKGKKIIVVCIIIAVSLIFLSEFLPSGNSSTKKPQETAQTVDEYTAQLETRVMNILESIEGVGSAHVMITLEATAKNVYAAENKQTTEKSETKNGDNYDTNNRNDIAQNYIIIDTGDGESALLETTLQPKINGVVVVCDGGESAQVQAKVINAVTVAMGIRSNQVFVTKKST